MQLLDFIFPVDSVVQKTGNIQLAGITRWPGAVTACYTWPWGYAVQQLYTLNGYGFCQVQVYLKKPLLLQIAHKHAAAYLLYTMPGSASYMHNGHNLLHLLPGSYIPIYLPEGNISVYMQPGTYYFIFQALSFSALQQVTDMLLPTDTLATGVITGSTVNFNSVRLRITDKVQQLIADIYAEHRPTANWYIHLQKCYNSLLNQYNRQLQQVQQPGYIRTPKEYITEMEMYIADNILHPQNLTLQTISSIFKIEKRSIERYFLLFTQSSFRRFVHNNKMLLALCMLQDNLVNIKDAAYQLGYSKPQNFVISFNKHFGFKPALSPGYFTQP